MNNSGSSSVYLVQVSAPTLLVTSVMSSYSSHSSREEGSSSYLGSFIRLNHVAHYLHSVGLKVLVTCPCIGPT